MKALRVTVVFEFDNIKDPNGEQADRIVQELTMDTEVWRTQYGAGATWVDEVEVVEMEDAA